MEKRFRPVFIEATTLDDAWHQILFALAEKGRRYEITAGSHAGSARLTLDYVAGFVHRPHERPLAPMVPEGKGLAAPTTDDYISAYFAEYLMDPRLNPGEEYRYATWIVGGNGLCRVKQLDWIIEHFRKAGLGNEHCAVTIGDAESLLAYDRPYKVCDACRKWFPEGYEKCPFCAGTLVSDETKRGTSPCLRLLDFRVVDGALMTHVVYRSWDAYGGFPTNMGGFTLLNEYVASEIGVEPGPLSFSCKSLHVYEHHLAVLEARTGKRPYL